MKSDVVREREDQLNKAYRLIEEARNAADDTNLKLNFKTKQLEEVKERLSKCESNKFDMAQQLEAANTKQNQLRDFITAKTKFDRFRKDQTDKVRLSIKKAIEEVTALATKEVAIMTHKLSVLEQSLQVSQNKLKEYVKLNETRSKSKRTVAIETEFAYITKASPRNSSVVDSDVDDDLWKKKLKEASVANLRCYDCGPLKQKIFKQKQQKMNLKNEFRELSQYAGAMEMQAIWTLGQLVSVIPYSKELQITPGLESEKSPKKRLEMFKNQTMLILERMQLDQVKRNKDMDGLKSSLDKGKSRIMQLENKIKAMESDYLVESNRGMERKKEMVSSLEVKLQKTLTENSHLRSQNQKFDKEMNDLRNDLVVEKTSKASETQKRESFILAIEKIIRPINSYLKLRENKKKVAALNELQIVVSTLRKLMEACSCEELTKNLLSTMDPITHLMGTSGWTDIQRQLLKSLLILAQNVIMVPTTENVKIVHEKPRVKRVSTSSQYELRPQYLQAEIDLNNNLELPKLSAITLPNCEDTPLSSSRSSKLDVVTDIWMQHHLSKVSDYIKSVAHQQYS
ncbi:Dishevelled associated activator of morphogenesis 2 [Cichlidogyrus casuarinus]|uniref:Dishevelled associated activator of morphogenesis 2 n=1 Tax=Cichlidogyrus casuarinus TaxID=1844966 RepID=A0ABD2QD77_9PLAT